MNKINTSKGYTWNDEIEITLSNGMPFKMKLSDNKDAKYMWYICQSCGWETTLAEWNCWSCGNPFEPRDLKEAKSLFPEVKVQIEDPNRLVWYMMHRSWLCLQCDSYNANLPRDDIHSEETSCINCGHGYESGYDLLFEDSLASNPNSSAQQFKDSMLRVIDAHRNPPQIQVQAGEKSSNASYGNEQWWMEDAPKPRNHNKRNRASHAVRESQEITSPLWRNKGKIFLSVFWAAGIWYLVNYGFIEKVSYDIEVTGHLWTSTQYLEKYQEQTDDDWEKDVNSSNYDDFELIRRVQREASWDSYTVITGTRQVEDSSNCLKYDSPEEICSTPSEQCDSATINGVTVTGNCYTPAPSCYTPAKTCESYGTKPEDITETRYREHPYIYFSYMEWQVISSALQETWWLYDEITWKESPSHPYVENDRNLRYVQQPIVYTVKFDVEWQESDDINLPRSAWQEISTWISCSIDGTRWWWISSSNFLEAIQACDR